MGEDRISSANILSLVFDFAEDARPAYYLYKGKPPEGAFGRFFGDFRSVPESGAGGLSPKNSLLVAVDDGLEVPSKFLKKESKNVLLLSEENAHRIGFESEGWHTKEYLVFSPRKDILFVSPDEVMLPHFLGMLQAASETQFGGIAASMAGKFPRTPLPKHMFKKMFLFSPEKMGTYSNEIRDRYGCDGICFRCGHNLKTNYFCFRGKKMAKILSTATVEENSDKVLNVECLGKKLEGIPFEIAKIRSREFVAADCIPARRWKPAMNEASLSLFSSHLRKVQREFQCGKQEYWEPEELEKYLLSFPGREYFEDIYPSKELVRRFIGHLSSNGLRVPDMIEHGDATAPNILYSQERGDIILMDWEKCNTHGEPFCDLFSFISTLPKGADNITKAAASSSVAEYFGGMGMGPDILLKYLPIGFYRRMWSTSITKSQIKRKRRRFESFLGIAGIY